METNTLILKYNDEEFRETGKWYGIDQLAEAYTSTSTYAYVGNNPVSQFDVDGRWMDDNGHIDTSGNANPFRDMAQSQMRMTQFMGRNPGEGGAGGYLAFGDTRAYADLMASFQNGGDFSLKVNNGYMSWWTGGALGDANTAQEMIAHMMKLGNYSDDVDWSRTASQAMWWTNTSVGGLSAYTVYKGAYHISNEVWHKTKSGNTWYSWSKLKNGKRAFDNNMIQLSQKIQSDKVAKIRGISSKLTKAGGVLIAADIVLSGEVKPSHIINGAMLGASTTGVGAIVAGVWFIADVGTMGVNYLVNGQAKGLGDMLDESIGTYKMYDGLY